MSAFEEEEFKRMAKAMFQALEAAQQEQRLEAMAHAPIFPAKAFRPPWWRVALYSPEGHGLFRLVQLALLALLLWRLW